MAHLKIFIDTEFTGLDTFDFDLISIGLVSQDGREFYAERDDFDPGLCNDFVRCNVLPILRAPKALVMSMDDLKVAVAAWLAMLENERPVICYDHMIDWSLLWELYDKNTPVWLGARNIKANLDLQMREDFFSETRMVQHHALHDARANCFAMRLDSDFPPVFSLKKKMNIHIASDMHLEFTWQRTKLLGHTGLEHVPGTDLLILAGDIGVGTVMAQSTFQDWPTPILYIAGNHEYYGGDITKINKELRERCEGTHIHFLERDSIVIGGVRFLGTTLWTDYLLYGKEKQGAAKYEAQESLNDHSRIRDNGKKFTPENAMHRFFKSKQWLREQLATPFDGKTVVITHHAPHWNSVHEKYRSGTSLLSAAFVSDMTDLMGQAALWIHGHGHDSFDYMVHGTRVISNPRGYPMSYTSGGDEFENEEWSKQFLVDI